MGISQGTSVPKSWIYTCSSSGGGGRYPIITCNETRVGADVLMYSVLVYSSTYFGVLRSRCSFTQDSIRVLWDARCGHGCYSCLNGH